MNRKHPIDDFFKEELDGHQLKPKASVWEKIESEIQPASSSRKGGYFFMRAAVISLLIGLSALLYFQNNEDSMRQLNPISHSNNPEADEEAKSEGKEDHAGSKKQKPEAKSEKPAAKKRQAIPVMNPSAGRKNIYVARPPEDDFHQVSDEELLAVNEEPLLTEELRVDEPRRYKVKVKLNPNTVKAFYAQADSSAQEDGRLSEKLLAYANNQMDNLLSGKKIELPKAERKPQLEINLPRIF